MKPLNSHAKANLIVFNVVFCGLIALFYSCGSGGSDDASGRGSVSFSLAMQGQGAGPASNIRAAADAASQFECQTDSYTIASIEAQIVDENNENLADGGPWACEDHQGTISDVAAGNGRIAIVTAKDESGNTIAEGQSDPLTVIAGQTANAGTIILNLFNSAPVADAGPDQTPIEGDTVILDGSGSSDVDGDLLTYLWSFTSLPPGSEATLSDPTAVNPTFVVDARGTYEVQLIVNDGTVDSAPDTVKIDTQNSAPVADAGPDQTPFVNDTVTLDGSGSSDVNDDALTYLWSFTRRPAGSGATLSDPTAVNPTFLVDFFGTYEVQLIVNDRTVDSDPDTVIIDTQNSAPVADAGPDQRPFVGDTVTLDGSGSSDVDRDILSYSWSFASLPGGSKAALSDPTAVNPTFLVDAFGTYVVQLIVNDGTVDSNSPDTVTIVTQNQPPVLNPIGPQSTSEYSTLQFTISASDPDRQPLNFPQPADLPNGASFTDNRDNTATFSWTPIYPDSLSSPYTVTFTVFDNQSPALSDTEEVTITVNPGG